MPTSKINKIREINESAEKPHSKYWGTQANPKDLIALMTLLSFSELALITEKRSTKFLKRFQKIPLISLLFFTATLAGLNQTQLKLVGFSLIDGQFW